MGSSPGRRCPTTRTGQMTGSLFFDDDARVVMGRDVAKGKEGQFLFFLFYFILLVGTPARRKGNKKPYN